VFIGQALIRIPLHQDSHVRCSYRYVSDRAKTNVVDTGNLTRNCDPDTDVRLYAAVRIGVQVTRQPNDTHGPWGPQSLHLAMYLTRIHLHSMLGGGQSSDQLPFVCFSQEPGHGMLKQSVVLLPVSSLQPVAEPPLLGAGISSSE